MRKLLNEGSELYLNRCGGLWVVDIFPTFRKDGTPYLVDECPEPTYHAAYDSLTAAWADVQSWRGWEE